MFTILSFSATPSFIPSRSVFTIILRTSQYSSHYENNSDGADDDEKILKELTSVTKLKIATNKNSSKID